MLAQEKHSKLNKNTITPNKFSNTFVKKLLQLNIPSDKQTPISNIETLKSMKKSISFGTAQAKKNKNQILITTVIKESKNQVISYSFIGGIKINQIQRDEKPQKKNTYYAPQISKATVFTFQNVSNSEEEEF
eukprot:TRINITY_DN13342_c0_g1_i1.p1 TRINITY_DN13342_c0_g1~~TRINITY_DN13342_c0_g1_i1.p1  ORF type:complete len:132 (+),score=19.20 TRINITY_DN13342_c0_g1_i1:29-424(+)